jgi:hypothetical protein
MNGADRPAEARPHSRLALHGWRRAAVELAGLALGLVSFSGLHNRAGTDVAAATAHAQAVQTIERSLHLDIELAANQWLAERPVLTQAAVLYYRLYYLPLIGVLLWVLFARVDVYRTVRRTLVVMAPLALLIFWLLPMSPPRFAMPGIVDIVAQHDLFGNQTSRDLTTGQNHFSAMPSLHVGWSALCAHAAWLALRDDHPRFGVLVWLFPIVMVAVVITTGNHYVLDVVGSMLLLIVSIAAATLWSRWRRFPVTST